MFIGASSTDKRRIPSLARKTTAQLKSGVLKTNVLSRFRYSETFDDETLSVLHITPSDFTGEKVLDSDLNIEIYEALQHDMPISNVFMHWLYTKIRRG